VRPYEVRDGYAAFIRQFQWDAFYTITCRKPRRDTIAFVRDVREKLFNANPQTRSFIAIEPHRTGMLHAHGLVHWHDALEKEYVRTYFNKRARQLFGFSRFSQIRSNNAVNNYCAKYVTKNDDYEYDFFGDWS